MDGIVYKTANFKAIDADESTGIVKAIVSVYDVADEVGDIIKYGAFSESIEKRMPSVAYHHEWNKVVGKTLVAKELPAGDPLLPEAIRDKGGLYVEGQFVKEIEASWQTFLSIKHGLLTEYSIGFMIQHTEKSEDGMTYITKGRLIEWSPVMMGANPHTGTISTKNLPLHDDTKAVIAEVSRLVNRWEQRGDVREKAGRVFSQANFAEMEAGVKELQGVIDRFKNLLAKAQPSSKMAKARIRMAALRAKNQQTKEQKS